MYSFHESLIPFSSTITLPDTPFRQFDPVISSLSFTNCFAIRKISFCWLRSFKSLAHSLCFFPFTKEITLFAFCLLFLYSFHASVDFSFFQFPYFFFFSLTASATSSFHHHVSLCLHGLLTIHMWPVLYPSLYFLQQIQILNKRRSTELMWKMKYKLGNE